MADPPIRQPTQPTQSGATPQYDLGNLPALRRAHVQRWLCGTFIPGTHQEGGTYEFMTDHVTKHNSHIKFAQAALAIRSNGYVLGRLDLDSGYSPGWAFLNMASKELEVPGIEKRQIKNTIAWAVGFYANNGEKIHGNNWFEIAGPLTLLVYRARHPELCPLP